MQNLLTLIQGQGATAAEASEIVKSLDDEVFLAVFCANPSFLEAEINTLYPAAGAGAVTTAVADDVADQTASAGLAALTSDDLAEGSLNLFFTQARWLAELALINTDSVTEGSTNRYYSATLFDTDFAGKTTDDLSVGSTNLYYLSTLFDADLATKTTTDLAEGTNLYHTDARADARVQNALGSIGSPAVDEWVSSQELADRFAYWSVTQASNPVVNTNNSAPADVINATTTTLPAGTYHMTVSGSCNADSNSSDIIIALLVDGVNTGSLSSHQNALRIEMKDSAGTPANTSGTGSFQNFPFTRIFEYTFATATTHTVQLTVVPEANGVEASAWDCFISLSKKA